MTCREAGHLTMPYINGSIADEELGEFLNRIKHYENRREELEIYFTMGASIRQLDEGTGNYSI